MMPLRILLAACLASAAPFVLATPQVACHYSYGGETHTLRAAPSASPHSVDSVPVGCIFIFA